MISIEHAFYSDTLIAKFGTTPEKLAEGREIISRDVPESKTPLKLPPNKKSIPSKSVMSSEGTISSSNATFPAMSAKNAAAFPPMSTLSPKPFSLNANVSKAPSMPKQTSQSQGESGNDVDYKGLLTKFFEESCPGKVAEVESTLQKYKVSKTEINN
jgi:hypothetical protein